MLTENKNKIDTTKTNNDIIFLRDISTTPHSLKYEHNYCLLNKTHKDMIKQSNEKLAPARKIDAIKADSIGIEIYGLDIPRLFQTKRDFKYLNVFHNITTIPLLTILNSSSLKIARNLKS